MHPSSVNRVRASYAEVSLQADRLVDRFYQLLFERNPDVRALFPADMARQKQHLIAALGLICKNIDCLDILEGSLMDLGAQHVAYGAKPEHYPLVRDCLLDSIQECSGQGWTPQLRGDWFEALNAICTIMLRGAARDTLSVVQSMSPRAKPGRRPDSASEGRPG